MAEPIKGQRQYVVFKNRYQTDMEVRHWPYWINNHVTGCTFEFIMPGQFADERYNPIHPMLVLRHHDAASNPLFFVTDWYTGKDTKKKISAFEPNSYTRISLKPAGDKQWTDDGLTWWLE